MSNAGQHGAPGRPIRVMLDGTGADVVEIRVHNEGAVPDRARATLFDPFGAARGVRESTRGLGLGLYIVRALAAAHGGSLEVTSTVDDGTTVRLRLPRWVTPVSAAPR